jgi:hypothetical protein
MELSTRTCNTVPNDASVVIVETITTYENAYQKKPNKGKGMSRKDDQE